MAPFEVAATAGRPTLRLYPRRGCEKAIILHGPVVDVPSFTCSRKDLATVPPGSGTSLNLRIAPSGSPDARSCCPSSMGFIHFGSSGGGEGACADSEARALALLPTPLGRGA